MNYLRMITFWFFKDLVSICDKHIGPACLIVIKTTIPKLLILQDFQKKGVRVTVVLESFALIFPNRHEVSI